MVRSFRQGLRVNMTQDDIERMADRLAKANRRYFYVYVAGNILIVTIWFCITSYNLYTYKKESDELLERIRQIHTVVQVSLNTY